MEILFVLIPLSVLLIAFALWSFVWSVKNDQFEDLDRQGWSILFDQKDSPAKTPAEEHTDSDATSSDAHEPSATEDTKP